MGKFLNQWKIQQWYRETEARPYLRRLENSKAYGKVMNLQMGHFKFTKRLFAFCVKRRHPSIWLHLAAITPSLMLLLMDLFISHLNPQLILVVSTYLGLHYLLRMVDVRLLKTVDYLNFFSEKRIIDNLDPSRLLDRDKYVKQLENSLLFWRHVRVTLGCITLLFFLFVVKFSFLWSNGYLVLTLGSLVLALSNFLSQELIWNFENFRLRLNVDVRNIMIDTLGCVNNVTFNRLLGSYTKSYVRKRFLFWLIPFWNKVWLRNLMKVNQKQVDDYQELSKRTGTPIQQFVNSQILSKGLGGIDDFISLQHLDEYKLGWFLANLENNSDLYRETWETNFVLAIRDKDYLVSDISEITGIGLDWVDARIATDLMKMTDKNTDIHAETLNLRRKIVTWHCIGLNKDQDYYDLMYVQSLSRLYINFSFLLAS